MKPHLHILHLEDDAADARLVADNLLEGSLDADITLVDSYQSFHRALDDDGFDLMLADFKLAGFDGLQALALWREKWPHKPFLFVTGSMGEERAVESLRSGATDYVLKENLIRLVPALRRATTEAEEQARRRKAEAALQASEERLELAFRAAQDGIWDWNMETDEVFYSSRYKAMLGYEETEIEHHLSAWKRLVHPDDRQPTLDLVAKVMRGEAEYVVEFRMRHKDGHYVDILSRGFPVRREPGGPIVRIVGTHCDLTERKRAEQLLGASEERFRLVAETIAEVFWITTCSSDRVLYVSPGIERLWGRSAETVTADPTLRLEAIHPEDRPRLEDSLRLSAAGGSYEIEYRVVRPDGSVCWVEDRGYPIRDTQGRISMLTSVCSDVTKRHQLEEQVKASQEKKFRAIFEGASDGILLVDSATRKVVLANNKACRMLGYTAEEFATLRVEDLHPEADRPWILEKIRTLNLDDDITPPPDLPVKRKDGSVFEASLSLARVALAGKIYVAGFCRDVTERSMAEAALKESETRYRTLVENLPLAVIVMDTSYRITMVNEAASKLAKANRLEDLVGRSAWEFLVPEEEPGARTRAAVLAERGAVQPLERKFRCLDGSTVWVESRAIALKNVQGEIIGVLGIAEDISPRKRAEARVARDKLRTEFLLELHQRAPQLTDQELYDHVLGQAVQLTSSTIGFIHQVSADENTILLTTWNTEATNDCTAVCDSHHPLADAGNWVDCVRQRRPVIYNDFASSPNQRGLPVGHAGLQRFMSMPVIQEGQVRIIFGVGNKATDYDDEDLAQLQVVANELHKLMDQRKAQQQVHESEVRFRQLVETSYDWVWEMDPQGRYSYASPRVEDLLGYASNEVLGKSPFDFMIGAEGLRAKETLDEMLQRGQPFFALETLNRHKCGREVWLETTGVPVLGTGGELLGYRGMDRDITGRRLLELQLRQAQKLDAVGQLAGGVAHDFNNILAAIMMHLGLMMMDPSVEQSTRSSLKELEAEARRAATLVRQLLMFSRRSVLAMQVLNLNDVVANLLNMLRRIVGEHMDLRFDETADLPLVEADAGMMEQVLLNLVVNARDAMPKGGRITVSTAVTQLGPSEVAHNAARRAGTFSCLTVSDTGCGMDAETLARLFEPFFTTKEVGQGTGLGLATVHGIIAQHRGWVEVESKVDAGSTFRIFLPTAVAVTASTDSPVQEEALPAGQETILLVEDETKLRQTFRQVLTALGYRVLEAANGQEAIKMWAAHHGAIDLLLTDMVMAEGMTGMELAERLKAERPDLKAIISSGYSAEMAQAGLKADAGVTYLPKPYSVPTLAEVVRQCLDQRS